MGWGLALIQGRTGIKNVSGDGQSQGGEEEVEFEELSVIQSTWSWSFVYSLRDGETREPPCPFLGCAWLLSLAVENPYKSRIIAAPPSTLIIIFLAENERPIKYKSTGLWAALNWELN